MKCVAPLLLGVVKNFLAFVDTPHTAKTTSYKGVKFHWLFYINKILKNFLNDPLVKIVVQREFNVKFDLI